MDAHAGMLVRTAAHSELMKSKIYILPRAMAEEVRLLGHVRSN